MQTWARGATSNGCGPVTENPALGATEIWELYNVTADAHPIHIHEVAFEVVNRRGIVMFEETKQVQINSTSLPTPPEQGKTHSRTPWWPIPDK